MAYVTPLLTEEEVRAVLPERRKAPRTGKDVVRLGLAFYRKYGARGWTKDAFARAYPGASTHEAFTSARDIRGSGATCFCASGVLVAVIGTWGPLQRGAWNRLERFLPKTHKGNLWGFNDDPATEFEDVLRLFERAAK